MSITLERAEWLDRFAMRLGELAHKLDPTEVSSYAAALYPDEGAFSPEEAAEIFALELPPLDASH